MKILIVCLVFISSFTFSSEIPFLWENDEINGNPKYIGGKYFMLIYENEHNIPFGSFVEVNIENGDVNYNNYIEDAIYFSISDDGSTVIKITKEEKLILIDPVDLSEIREIELPDLRSESDTSTRIDINISKRILDDKYIWINFQQGNNFEKCVIFDIMDNSIVKEIEYYATRSYSTKVHYDFSKDGSKFFFTITGRRNIQEPSNIFIYSFPDFELLHKEAEWVYDIKSFKEFPNSNRLLLFKDTIIYDFEKGELIKTTYGARTADIYDFSNYIKTSELTIPREYKGKEFISQTVDIVNQNILLLVSSSDPISIYYSILENRFFQLDYMKDWSIFITGRIPNSDKFHIYCSNKEEIEKKGLIEFNSLNLSVFEQNEVSIFPNPTSDIINIDTKTATNIELFDIFGNKILEDYNTKLDISHLSPGTYYIRFLGQTKMVVKI